MKLKMPVILFFTADAVPTVQEQYAAMELAPASVRFRNVQYVPESGATEACDAVAGIVDIPKLYAHFPSPQEAIEKMRAEWDADLQSAEAKAETKTVETKLEKQASKKPAKVEPTKPEPEQPAAEQKPAAPAPGEWKAN